jgi:hypothetical protein
MVMMMEAVRASEKSVNFYEATRRFKPEEGHLPACRSENLKFRFQSVYLPSYSLYIALSCFFSSLSNTDIRALGLKHWSGDPLTLTEVFRGFPQALKAKATSAP